MRIRAAGNGMLPKDMLNPYLARRGFNFNARRFSEPFPAHPRALYGIISGFPRQIPLAHETPYGGSFLLDFRSIRWPHAGTRMGTDCLTIRRSDGFPVCLRPFLTSLESF
jgi:hypothetical protein